MIAKLKGRVEEVFPTFIILDVNGVGYKVEGDFLNVLEGNDIEAYIFTYVREQDLRLFGFSRKSEFILFEKLLQISGVGPKAALALISNVGTDQILTAINSNEPKLLKTTGVGNKTAQRIIIEMKNKIDKLGIKVTKDTQINLDNINMLTEVEEALIDLGYNKNQIKNVLEKLNLENKTSVDLVKEALQLFNRSNE
ncbi:Holliday junction branch migration protein RuvA [Candidatus Dojkabacteria bacterium]|uniref:Holliday junction branch migration complex subunit RuvA n=1 Tax=Candidatus Dojkabacteria bacterium TaxID=2099670 RepID=A0A955RJ89_9BACT|nr:Holliday junction branch migration protein RuvA [Candidatus Dojkabacteria bacterium]